ncbi:MULTISPECIES: histidine phosphatase family protein [unclassified Clostridium]|uniref:histidine phosphatase family protein n=1 Tax=unclassified Clostridium TaxID=2614128 RepID=UPI0025B99182|nr:MULTISPECIES: histidine phosphatase family protein [unclassified Clostridium]
MNIYLVRHGETIQNKNKVFYGTIDEGLTEKGIIESKKLSAFFKKIDLDMVYLSNKKRTYETSKIILSERFKKLEKNNKIVIDKRINETNFGEFEGKSYEELLKFYPKECDIWEKDWKGFVPPSGESYIELYNRASDFLKDILNLTCDNVLVVTHSGVIRAIYSYIMNENMDLFWKFSSRNGDISIIKYEYENLFLDGIIHNKFL